MSKIELFVTTFGRPDLLSEQKRLLDKFLTDDYGICVIDNTPSPQDSAMETVCRQVGVGYRRNPADDGLHTSALNYAAQVAHEQQFEYWGTVDHDLFLRREYSLIERIKPAGFYGMGQFHAPSTSRYLFPGFAFFSREWLNGRIPDFSGFRGEHGRDNGDAGSMLHSLFTQEDWDRVPLGEHAYGFIRPDDGQGIQSWGYEIFDQAFVHWTNASSWYDCPNPAERNRLLMEMTRAL